MGIMVFHGFWSVSLVFQVGFMVFMVFHGFWLVSMVCQGGLMVFHGFWLVSMVFQGGFMIFHGFWLVSMVFQGGVMVFAWCPWFFKVVSWFFVGFHCFSRFPCGFSLSLMVPPM